MFTDLVNRYQTLKLPLRKTKPRKQKFQRGIKAKRSKIKMRKHNQSTDTASFTPLLLPPFFALGFLCSLSYAITNSFASPKSRLGNHRSYSEPIPFQRTKYSICLFFCCRLSQISSTCHDRSSSCGSPTTGDAVSNFAILYQGSSSGAGAGSR